MHSQYRLWDATINAQLNQRIPNGNTGRKSPSQNGYKTAAMTVRKVAKSCTEIETKLGTMEERIVAVEEDVDSLKQQNVMQESQMTDVMWKLEDLENRYRRNNLRFLGIEEGLEGNDIRDYMIKLLQKAFPN
ncbi:hypothetical protein NDU88_003290 [Pleurodeles waltl]|uniref:Uncharacterized protein n=1 Tax=Pleurodeles waltl TaxID=8319 RepID=A0AAV7VF21_PLEWA|nr:hypothetical protein NDU88_003290 [Pleurodeles waltl]